MNPINHQSPPPAVDNPPRLNESYKGRFEFRLSVPSFVYPAGYAANVALLAPAVDEIELLTLESRESRLPDRREIHRLADLAQKHGITYNVHMPSDLDLSTGDPRKGLEAIERLTVAFERVAPLNPTSHTLHLTCKVADTPAAVKSWQQRTSQALDRLLDSCRIAPRRISIETLDYPPLWFDPVVNRHDLAVCIDMGHLLRYDLGLEKIWQHYSGRITTVHLHGVCQGTDHLALDQLPAGDGARVQACLAGFAGSLSLEVFSFRRLAASLPCLAAMFPKPLKSGAPTPGSGA